MIEAAVRAPNGGNYPLARFLVVTDREVIREFGVLYREAWWAKRHDEGLRDRDDLPDRYRAAAGLADAMGDVPCVALGLGSTMGQPTQWSRLSRTWSCSRPRPRHRLGADHPAPVGDDPLPRPTLGIPEDVGFHFCVPLGYPQGNFGPNTRKPTAETTFLDRWGEPVRGRDRGRQQAKPEGFESPQIGPDIGLWRCCW